MKQTKQFKTSLLSLAVLSSLAGISASAIAQEQEVQQEIEEVVATASRLKGSASAVIEERKNQAFVADIMGAEQISRTGDSDAASALRRVTGLSLVNDKFIYVRGLGERYSSVRLNGATVPSPDLTRNVIPLDIFPSSIIESLSVQKAYSPNMPAAFGGGDVNIRTKSIPSERVFKIELGAAYKSTNSKGYTYNGGDDDWLGTDDGTRAMPNSLWQGLHTYINGLSDISVLNIRRVESERLGSDIGQAAAIDINKGFIKALNRDYGLQEESLSPDFGGKLIYGDRFDDVFGMGGQFGFLASVAYDNEWANQEEFGAVLVSPEMNTNNCSKATFDCYLAKEDKNVTKHNIKLNTSLNLGYKLDGHDLNASYMMLRDSEDEVSVAQYQEPSKGLSIADGETQRSHMTSFEERELSILQLRGSHNFSSDYVSNLALDWHYTDSSATTEIPGELEINVRDRFANGQYQNSYVSAALGANSFRYRFVDMVDDVENWGVNLSKAFYFDGQELELSGGGYFVEKTRDYRTDFFNYMFASGETVTLATNQAEALNIGSFFNNDAAVDGTNMELMFQEPTADDYLAAQLIDAYYAGFDYSMTPALRVSGGVRYEDFRQTALAFSRSAFDPALLADKLSPEAIEQATVMEDEYFASLSLTYSQDSYQLRFGYGNTVVRPDLRELTPVQYQDPLTDYRTIGNPYLESSYLDNFDARVEFYLDNGDNFSVGAFYKDIDKPIEAKLSENDGRFTLQFDNATDATVYGIEAEWLMELTSNAIGGALFTSGNITLSDSEVSITEAQRGDLTNLTRRMTGHSKYVANFQLNYDAHNGNHQASLIYNVFGERILAAGVNQFDDAYEKPIHSLDMVYSYYPNFNTTVTFKVKNLLGQDFEVEQNDVLIRQKEMPTQISLDFSYEF